MEFDLNLVYRLLTDQHIGIADRLSQMPTRMLALSEDRLGKRISIALIKLESWLVKRLEDTDFISQYQKYKKLVLYINIVDYLERELLSLESLPQNKQRQIIWKAKKYMLSPPNEIPSLGY